MEADDEYFYHKPLEHTEREITWDELSEAWGLKLSSLGPVIKRSKRQATPYSGSPTSDEQDIERAYDEGTITLKEYAEDFLAFMEQSELANASDDEPSPVSVEEDLVPLESERFSVPLINTDENDASRIFQEDDYLAAVLNEDFPSPKSTFVLESSDGHEQEGKAIEEHLKSSQGLSSTPIVAETSNVRDIDREYDEGKITLKEYSDHFVTVVKKQSSGDNSADAATPYEGLLSSSVLEEDSLPIQQSVVQSTPKATMTISNEQDIEKAFDEGKITFKDYADHFLTFVEKHVPTDNSTPATASVVEEEPLRRKSTGVSSALEKAIADVSESDVDRALEEIFSKENADQFMFLNEKQVPAYEPPSDILDVSLVNRGGLNVDGENSESTATEASFVPSKQGRKVMMEKMMSSFGLSKDDLHKILINVQPLWETASIPKTRANSDDSRVVKKVTTDAPILHKTTPVPARKVKTSVSPMAKMIASSARDFAAEYKAGKITKSEYVNLVISSVRTKSPIATFSSRPKTHSKPTTISSPVTTSRPAIPKQVQSKNVAQSPVIAKTSLPTSIFSIFDKVPTPIGVDKKTVLSKTNSPLYAVFKKAPSGTTTIRKEAIKHVRIPNPFFAANKKASTSRESASGSKVPQVSGSVGNPLYAVFKKPPTSTRAESTPETRHEADGSDGNPLYAVFKRPTASDKTSSTKVTTKTEHHPWVSVDQDEFKYWKSAPISNLVDVVYGEAKPVFDKGVKSVPNQSQATTKPDIVTDRPISISYTKSLPRSFLSILDADAKKPSYEIHYHNYNVKLPHHVAKPFIQKLYHGLHTKSNIEDPGKALRDVTKVFHSIH